MTVTGTVDHIARWETDPWSVAYDLHSLDQVARWETNPWSVIYDLHRLGNVTGWELYNLHALVHVPRLHPHYTDPEQCNITTAIMG